MPKVEAAGTAASTGMARHAPSLYDRIAHARHKTAQPGAGETPAEKSWRLVYFASWCVIASVLLAGSMIVWPLFDKTSITSNHYALLAFNMVHGNLTVDGLSINSPDFVLLNGHKYLPLGPLPAIITIPFLPLMELGLRMVWIGNIFTLLNLWLFYKVLRKLNVGQEQLKWSLVLFFGGTVYLGLAFVGNAWYFAQLVTVTFLMAAVLETLSARRPFVMGLLLGLAGMTRFTAVFALPFFLVLLWKGTQTGEVRLSGKQFATKASLLAAGLVGPLALLGLYNYVRFGNPLDSGYASAVLLEPILQQARDQGLFSLVHVPKNLFMMLFQGPLAYPSDNAPVLEFPYFRPSLWGLGLVYTSPALIYAFRARRRQTFVWASWLGIICAMLPIITYYGVGWKQFGYRYALDFIPLLLLLAAKGMPNPMTNRAKALVLASLLVNLWGCIFLASWAYT